jgi:hypothetical protein
MYASDRLADRNFKLMSLAERGLLHTMELECWVNSGLPSEIGELTRVLGLNRAEVEAALTERVMRHFRIEDGAPATIVCPELLAYRAALAERRARMSEGGKQVQEKRRKMSHPERLASSHPSKVPPSHPVKGPASPLRGEVGNIGEGNEVENQSVYMKEHEDFLNEYEGPAPFEMNVR